MKGRPSLGKMFAMIAGEPKGLFDESAILGKTIDSITLDKKEDIIRIAIDGGPRVIIRDEGGEGSEERYISTDDNLQAFSGARYLGSEIREPQDLGEADWYHEVQFFVIKTDRGNLTFESHNKHNGFYGGFLIRARLDQ